ncbi:hypothetical protein EVAR_79636_1 [Eumeta japonica]|uniref:Uncharacterized protein n=1 Tax=Eumeta variegata TaxID=151549 RepID=A0A4C1UEM5_EUMVA|nr:hypothetical protein EVAR_79636_1 [Eumeta japonica]
MAQSTQSPTDRAIIVNTGSKPNNQTPPPIHLLKGANLLKFLQTAHLCILIIRKPSDDDIKIDLTAQGYPVYTVYRIHCKDGSAKVWSLWSYLRLRNTDLSPRNSQKCAASPAYAWRTHIREEVQSSVTAANVMVTQVRTATRSRIALNI